MRHTIPRQPKNREHFCWSRVVTQDGWVAYRLFRRDQRGVVHYRSVPFECGTDRKVIAVTINGERHDLRNSVDDVDLRLMGLT